MKRNRTKGFTLIEVTLAIVIGIILIAGATLIYNQAKTSAGNSRAQAKVASLQALVEQYIARADGVAPDSAIIRALWERARPDDFNKSPWGGIMNPAQYSDTSGGGGPAVDTKGLINGWAIDKKLDTNAVVPLTSSKTKPDGAEPAPAVGWTGALIYYKFDTADPYFIWDENKRTVAAAKTYTVASTDQGGNRWFFVRGNAAGVNSDNPFGLRGQIQN